MDNKKQNIVLIGKSAHTLADQINEILEHEPNVTLSESYAEGLKAASDLHPNVELVVISEALSDQDELYNLAMNIHPGEVIVIAELDQTIKCEQRLIGDMHVQHVNSQLPNDEIVSHIC